MWRIDMKIPIFSFLKNKSGATAIEYGLIAALISVVIIGTVSRIGTNLNAKLDTIATELDGTTTPKVP
jgi:pilus assembly protein Flp/PilA